MTATMHIGRRTTPHHLSQSLRERWGSFRLRHSRRVQNAYFTRLHDALPLNEDRHALEAVALEAAFCRLAVDNPGAVTPSDGGQAARDAEREQLLIATCDQWFREANPGPEHRWHPMTVASYHRLMDGVRRCFLPGGTS
ncbi:hypothetical protein KMT30_06845 [Streptomyces sp. IBSBF 2953]|nr:hypothetical protein [Streptomyces hayashii]